MNTEFDGEKDRGTRTSRSVRDQIVGKCISGVIARPGHRGEPPMVMMLQFDDGSVVEFVSPRSDRLLKNALQQTRRHEQRRSPLHCPDQLALAAM